MEDTQPNEVRLSRKGSTSIPHVRTSYSVHNRSSHNARPSKRSRRQPLATPFRQVLIEVRLPLEYHAGAGNHHARKRWIHDQKRQLWSNRHLSVVSFKYHDNSVLFTCRTRQAGQFSGHNARENIGTVHRDTDSISIVRSLGNHSEHPQNSDPGPSQIRLSQQEVSQSRGCHQPLDHQSAATAASSYTERKMKSCPVQTAHSNFTPQYQVATHKAPTTEGIIDLTLDTPDSVAERSSARWSTFYSGCMDIRLPPLSSGPRASLEANMSIIKQTSTQVTGPRGDAPQGSEINLPSLRPSSYANDRSLLYSMEDHSVGSLSGELCQPDGSEVGNSSCPRDHLIVPEDEPRVPSPFDCNSTVRNVTPTSRNLTLSLTPHDKPRRVLYRDNSAYVVTAHGIIDQVDTTNFLKWGRNIRSPFLPYEEFVDDACMLSHYREPVIILGHAREQNQITCLNLEHGQVSQHITLHRDWNTSRRPGTSAMTSLMSPLKFASGGYDHRVHIWDIAQDLSGALAVELPIKHSSIVHSLLPIVDTSHKLISVGADRDIPIYDLFAERLVNTFKISCTPYHAHRTESAFCTLFEVAHLETQFEVRDHRVPDQATQRFGFVTADRRGRYEKAHTWSHFVVCGDRNGAVHLWDLRNVWKEVASRQCFSDPVIQVVGANPRLLACSKRNELACIDFEGE